MDALTNILKNLRMSALVFQRAEVCAPWGVRTGRTATGIFHAVVRGRAWIRPDGDDRAYPLSSGDIALLPGGDGHTMSDDPRTPARPIGELLEDSPARETKILEIPGGGPRTSILCGTFTFEQSAVHPLVALLPRLVLVQAESTDRAEWVAGVLRLIATEVAAERPGSQVVLTRLADVLMVHALRVHIESDAGAPGWLSGLRDPQVARAIGLIHESPGQVFTVAELAAEVGMSRSGFFARFSELVGEPPTRYATRWRMHLAAQALTREGASLGEVASRIGYSTEGAFSKAFKRFTGMAPGEYRRRTSASV